MVLQLIIQSYSQRRAKKLDQILNKNNPNAEEEPAEEPEKEQSEEESENQQEQPEEIQEDLLSEDEDHRHRAAVNQRLQEIINENQLLVEDPAQQEGEEEEPVEGVEGMDEESFAQRVNQL